MRVSENQLKQVLADVFGIAANSVNETTSVDTVGSWDSLKHLNLVLALEERFNLRITEAQTTEILSYPRIKAVLEEHSVRFEV